MLLQDQFDLIQGELELVGEPFRAAAELRGACQFDIALAFVGAGGNP